MTRLRTCRFICFLILTSISLSPVLAKEKEEPAPEKAPWLSGIAVSTDIVGFAMKAVGAKFANMEVGARLNLFDKFFPVAELGIGDCSREGADNANRFSATAPYMRFGLDYNVNKKHNGNRLFAVMRYGLSTFSYDIGNPDFQDPVYGGQTGLSLSGEKATAQWIEFGIGLETKLWRFVRLGWSMRYKKRLMLSKPESGEPYFVPGFGKNGDSAWGGTVNLVFDVGKITKKKQKPAIESAAEITERLND